MRSLLVFMLLVQPTGSGFYLDACSCLPRTIGARDPSDSREPVPPAAYEPVTAGIRTYRPVEPLPWEELNKRIMPKSEGAPEPEKHH